MLAPIASTIPCKRCNRRTPRVKKIDRIAAKTGK
jgi:hypothetical protein